MFNKQNINSQINLHPSSAIRSFYVTLPFLIFLTALMIWPVTTYGYTRAPESITLNTTWTKENSPYIVKDTVVGMSATLRIEEGTKVEFEYPDMYSLEVRGNLIIHGSKDHPVELSGNSEAIIIIKGSSTIEHANIHGILGIDVDHGTLNVGSSTFSGSSAVFGEYSTTTISSTTLSHDLEFNGNAISLNNSRFVSNDVVVNGRQNISIALRNSFSRISSTSVMDSNIGIMVTSGTLLVERGRFSNRRVGVQLNSNGGPFPVFNNPFNSPGMFTGGIGNAEEGFPGPGSDFTIHNSSFMGNNRAIQNDSDSIIDAAMNWWGQIMPPEETNHRVVGKVNWNPALTSDPFGPQCCSNLVFIPGIQGSRLHEGNNQLWEPNRDADVLKLVMSTTSKTNITVGGIIDRAYGFKPVYQPMIDLANDLVASGSIKYWQPVPYDWRQSPYDLVKNVTNTIIQVASTSTTGKVSIVAHSYGGLIAKSVIKELESTGMNNIIDKLMLIASPEYGSAKALPAMLHGYSQNILGGILLSEKVARALGQSIPSAYDLLPSDSFLEQSKPIAKFLSNPLIIPDSSQGLDVTSINGRVSSAGDLVELFVKISDNFKKYFGRLNPSLLGEAISLHDVMDKYVLPNNIQTLRIASWGIPTLATTIYRNSNHCIPILIRFCTNTLNVTAAMQEDGDGTVSIGSVPVASSTVYLDLGSENRRDNTSITHAYIAGSKSMKLITSKFVTDQIPKDVNKLPEQELKKISEFMSYKKPDKFRPLYTITIHSPVSLRLCNIRGKCTGLAKPDRNGDKDVRGTDLERVIADVSGTDYAELADSKYIVAPIYEYDGKPIDYDIVLDGEDYGVATLNIDAGLGSTTLPSMELKDFLVSPRAKGHMKLNAKLLRGKSLVLELEDDKSDLDKFLSKATSLLPNGVILSGYKNDDLQTGPSTSTVDSISSVNYSDKKSPYYKGAGNLDVQFYKQNQTSLTGLTKQILRPTYVDNPSI